MNKYLMLLLTSSLLLSTITIKTNAQAINTPQSSAKAQAQQAFNKLIQQRTEFHHLFIEAYKLYPNLPAGILESIAYSASRWQHRLPSTSPTNLQIHDARPQAIGLFGLYNINEFGFKNTLALVANNHKITSTEMLASTELYINATAHYLSTKITQQKILSSSIEYYKKIIASVSGIQNDKAITRYAQQSFIYDVFLALDSGIQKNGIYVPQQAITWKSVFNKAQLQQLKSAKMILTGNNQTIAIKPAEVDYPSALWVATPNQSSRKGADITHIVIHTTQGSYASSITWLANSQAQASAHYVIRSSDGQITQMVRDVDKAWHARSANPYTIGIEHEGFVDNPDWYTDAMYNASADLTKYKCANHPVDCTKGYAGRSSDTVVVLDTGITVKGHQHYTGQNHTDPGINWDWPRYFALITDGQVTIPNQAPIADFKIICTELSCDFDGSLSSDSDGSVNAYQWDFGDGNKSTDMKVKHNYAKAGSYSVTLTILDNEKASHSKSSTIAVAKKVVTPTKEKSSGGSIYGLLLLSLAFFSKRKYA